MTRELCFRGQIPGPVGLARPGVSRLRTSATKLKEKEPDVDANDKAHETQRQDLSKREPSTFDLPGGYKITRRDALKLVPAVGILGAAYSIRQNWQAFSYVSPQALLKAALPGQNLPQGQESSGDLGRVDAFKQFIAEKESRRVMQTVPDFQSGLTWFNSTPLSLGRELQGKVVVLDFWTYCCINCMHVLPSLAALERRYTGKPVAVVGVHSAKFDNEQDDDSIRNAVLRYEIQHPCVNDNRMSMWRALGISSWPTLAIVSPAGKLIATLPGEGQEENVDAFIQAALSYYGERQMLVDSPLPIQLEKDKDARLLQSPLRFPGKVATDVAGERLFVSDSNNNRIVVTDFEGNFLDQIGGNGAQLMDGGFESSSFNRPQGLAYSSKLDAIFVADTENHALRKVDLKSKTVTTLAGNGQRGSDYNGGKAGVKQALNSPWDLTLDNNEEIVYIALAGQHQIWVHHLSSGRTEVFSGNGAERNVNSSSPRTTSWAQPSGLSICPESQEMLVADSESSCIRATSLSTGSSRALVGGDPNFADNLFRFGDRDGYGSDALLQHPLAVFALDRSTALVADTYNHRIKKLDLQKGRLSAFVGKGSAGFADGMGLDAKLSEPSGFASGKQGVVFVTDTNNHVIRKLQLDTGDCSTLQLRDVPPPRKSPDAATDQQGDELISGAESIPIPIIQASRGSIRVQLRLPENHHLTKGANSSYSVRSKQPGAISFQPPIGPLLNDDQPTFDIHFRRSASASAVLYTQVYFCVDGGECLFRELAFLLSFDEKLSGEKDILVEHEISI